jgi:hypothetical protein
MICKIGELAQVPGHQATVYNKRKGLLGFDCWKHDEL